MVNRGVALIGMTACQHKRLCEAYECPSPRLWVAADYRQEREIPYIGLTDWEMNWPSKFGIAYDELRPAMPQGPHMSFYADDALLGSTNLPTHDGQYRRQYGDYTLLFHNNDTEYIMFADMNHFSTARATTRKVTRSQDGTQTAPPPDMLYGCHRDNFRIGADTRTLHVELQPMVFSYLIRYEFLSGIEHIAQARGTLSGIADGVMLHNEHTSSTPVSLLYNADLTPWGYNDGNLAYSKLATFLLICITCIGTRDKKKLELNLV